eukprot:gene21483-22357_t
MRSKVLKKSTLVLIASVVVALLIALAPLVLGKVVLQQHAISAGKFELDSIGARYLSRAERVLSEAVGALRDLDRSKLLDCSPTSRMGFSDAVSRSSFLRRVGVVDDNGFAMCLEPPPSIRRGAMMAALSDATRQVTIAVADTDSAPDMPAGTVVVGWRSVAGKRIIAELSAGALDIDAGAEVLRDRRYVEVLIDGGYKWTSAGRGEGRTWDDPSSLMVDIRSEIFPIEVRAQIGIADTYVITKSLDLTLTVSSLSIGLMLISVAIWLNWRPDQASHDEFVKALKDNEFIPYYQPVMNIDTGQIEGCEMLVRWQRRDGTVVSPGAFMPYAETSGHVFDMTRAIMRQSVKDLGELYSRKNSLKLSINLFAGHFDDRGVIEDIEEIFGDGPIAFDQLVFEVTERYPLNDIERARKIIAEMHALGCRVALDDTGTGHGGLAYLQQL